MPKYRNYVRKMFEEHEAEFQAFSEIHAKYQQDQQKHQEEFNKIGKPIADIITDYERKLCGHSEKGKYAVFSSKLAEKFREEIKAFFPLIDFIGVKVSGPPIQIQSENDSNSPKKPTPKAVDPDIAEIEDMDLDDFDLPKLF